MRDFFKGWRRKLGCLTLVMAFALFTLCMRSLVTWDCLAFDIGERQQLFIAKDGWLMWDSFPDEIDDGFIGTIPASDQAEFAEEFDRLQHGPGYHELFFPLWPVVLLVATCSASLILWDPRPKPPL